MDEAAKKTLLRTIPYGLYVLITDGDPVGTGTINWVSQMSFGPPLLALGVKTDSRNFANLKAGGGATLSFLASGQGDTAFAFFGDAKLKGNAFVTKKAEIPFERAPSGVPVLAAAFGFVDLKVHDTVEIGDHAVVVTEVTEASLSQEEPQILTLSELGLNYSG